ncbi:hypothetical protein IMG5_100510 [Ichthyophthirius multifiliis]|uniref:RanBP2-type domain-containing protein n=1 Tax=Ichthyophthirius multifiliis TaxID=5932 RepID=G0QSA3_ICHMU|nr:hypothetical protein IMG5_100510 [Ichthyophthirius multifiliis]EGR31901.1 hypothetical protein IMG5_100510 [Ichthyophthirius multifiliis]|eukprot:XP_004035387.1 hypothetical protein IMG5_100510 [Ichthyophthirius multifiliis]
MYQPEISENKLLKYWEKFVIPKIYDFVKTTLKQYELEDFFEQIRQPLRKGDQTRAASVAYIICEKNLPQGVVLPDANHDWDTISIEEVKVGQWLLATIYNTKNNQVLSPFFIRERNVENTTVCVEAIGIDVRNSSVLCLYHDHDQAHLITLWLPVTSLRLTEVPVRPPSSNYPEKYIVDQFQETTVYSIGLLFKQTLLQFFSLNYQQEEEEQQFEKQNELLKQIKLDFIEIIKACVSEELADDPVYGWFKMNGSSAYIDGDFVKNLQFQQLQFMQKQDDDQLNLLRSRLKKQNLNSQQSLGGIEISDGSLFQQQNPFRKLRQIQNFINWSAAKKKQNTNLIFEYVLNAFPSCVSLISKFVQEIDLVQMAQNSCHDGEIQNSSIAKPFNLCQFDGADSYKIGSVILSFHKDTQLGIYSGCKFFTDSLGINCLYQINAGKKSTKNLEPIIFKGSDIYCTYYFNKHQLSPFEIDQKTSSLPCLLHGVPSDWNLNCWIIDSLSTSLMNAKKEKSSVEMLGKIVGMLCDMFNYLYGPAIIKNLLAKLIINTVRKLRFLIKYQINSNIMEINKQNFKKKHWEIYNIKQDFVISNIMKVQEYLKKNKLDENSLYCSYIQDQIEMLSTILTPVLFNKGDFYYQSNYKDLLENSNAQKIPVWMEHIINLNVVFNFVDCQGILTQEIYNNLVLKQLLLKNNYQQQEPFQNILVLKNLPYFWNEDDIRKNIAQSVQKAKLRILNPVLDIFIVKKNITSSQQCFVLVDGSAFLDLEDVAGLQDDVQKQQQEEEQKVAEEQQEQIVEAKDPEFWNCPSCTLENPWESTICEICETHKPQVIEGKGEEDEDNEEEEKQIKIKKKIRRNNLGLKKFQMRRFNRKRINKLNQFKQFNNKLVIFIN